jgi:hypothetical protein
VVIKAIWVLFACRSGRRRKRCLCLSPSPNLSRHPPSLPLPHFLCLSVHLPVSLDHPVLSFSFPSLTVPLSHFQLSIYLPVAVLLPSLPPSLSHFQLSIYLPVARHPRHLSLVHTTIESAHPIGRHEICALNAPITEADTKKSRISMKGNDN